MNWDMTGIRTALDKLGGFIPNLIAGLVILLIGYIIAAVLGRVTRAILARVGFDRLTTRMGLTRSPETKEGSRWAGKAMFFVVMLVTIMQVAKTWDMGFVAVGFARLIAYVPHAIAAAVILALALLLGNWVRDRLVRSHALSRGNGQEPQVRLMPSIVRGVILAIGVFMALRELQIAPEIVNVAFTLMLGAVAVATALAFGLGSRDVAGRIAQSWYERRGELGKRLAEPAEGEVQEPLAPPPASGRPAPTPT